MKKNLLLTRFLLLMAIFFSWQTMSGQIIISQYIETNSGTAPKGIELWNVSGSVIDFSVTELVVKKGGNGGTPSPDVTISSGTVAAGDVFVVGTSDLSPDYVKAFTFNGNDALEIWFNGTKTDVFGEPGSDPGSAWVGNSVSTANQNIQLKTGITTGDIDGWTDPSERFETVSTDPVNDMTGFGTAPATASAVDNPTSFAATATSGTQIDLSWAQNTNTNDVIVAWASADVFGTLVDGSTYNATDAITGGGTVIYKGSALAFNHTGLTAGTQYFYKAWSLDATPDYSGGVTANATTLKAEPTNQVASFAAAAMSKSISLSWDENAGAVTADGYLLKVSTADDIVAPVDGTEEADDSDFSDGAMTVNLASGTTSYDISGLTAETAYYFAIYEYTNSDADIDYKTTGTKISKTTLSTIFYEEMTDNSMPTGWTVQDINANSNTWGFSSSYAKVSNYSSGSTIEQNDWFISPEINFAAYTDEALHFSSAAYGSESNLNIMYSTDYDGTSDPTGSFTWTPITTATLSSGGWTWTNSGIVDLSTIADGTGYLAFQLLGTTSASNTWEVDNIELAGTLTPTAPTTQATNMLFSNVTPTGFKVDWTRGDGAAVAVFVNEVSGGKPTVAPADATTYTASADWSSKGTQIGTTGYFCVYNGSGTTVTLSNLSESTNYQVTAYEYNEAPGSELYNGATATGNPASKATPAANDGNSTVNATGVTQPTADVSSLVNLEANAVEVFKFNVADLGTSDGLSTTLTQVKVVPGTNNTAAWSTTLAGAKLFAGATEVTATASITDASIVFAITAGAVLAEGTNEVYTVKTWLKSTVTDNEVLEFMVDANDNGFTATGTGFALDFTTDVVSEQLAVDVVATKLAFVQDASNAYAGVAMSPALTVEALDANNNRDLDATNSVTLTSTGTLDGTPSATLAAGFGTFSPVKHTATGTDLTVTAAATGLTSATSATFDVTEDTRTLFFSEYIEGTSSNRAIEIYNPTSSAIDLSGYVVKQSHGTDAFPSTTDSPYYLALEGTIAAKGVYVIANSSASAEILAVADTTFGYSEDNGHKVPSFTGDDALGLFNATTLIDMIGVDAGGATWDVAGVADATQNHTLVRKYPSVVAGNTNWTASAGTDATDSEWMVKDENDYSFIGWHGVQRPSVKNVTRFPTTPNNMETVSVSADVTDETTVASVMLNWGTTSGVLSNSIAMSVGTGDTYTTDTDIPAQAATTEVFYTVTATDNDGNVSTSAEMSYEVVLFIDLKKLVITAVSPASPMLYSSFAVTVQAQDDAGATGNVSTDTEVALTLKTGTGTISGTLTGTILAGTNEVTISGLSYDAVETIELAASVNTGMALTASANQSVVVMPLPTITVPFTEDFTTDMGDISTYSVSGDKVWALDADGYMEANGYSSGATEEDWMILPQVNMDDYATVILSFDMNYKYGTQDAENYLKLMYSADYMGVGDPSAATWTEVPFDMPSASDAWETSGYLDLSAITGTEVYLAFKYHYTDGNYTRWQLDNIKLNDVRSNATVVSSVYTVDEAQRTITNVPYGTYYYTFKGNVSSVDNGTYYIMESDGETPAGRIRTDYKVMAVAEDGVTVKFYTIVVDPLTDIAKLGGIEMKMYPNPVVNQLTLDNATTIKTVSVVAINGQVVKTAENNGNASMKLDMSNLESGIYLLNVENEAGERASVRIMKK